MSSQHTYETSLPDDNVSLIVMLSVLGESKVFIIGFSSFLAVVAAVVSLIMTPVYTARTVIMPPQHQQSSSSAILSSLNSIPGISSGGLAGLVQKSPDEMYVKFLTSESVQNTLIDSFNLKDRYKESTYLETRKALNNNLKVFADKKSGLITISVEDTDPKVAADIANANIKALSTLMGRLAVTEAQHKRVFFDAEIKVVESALSQAEQRFKTAQQRTGLQVPSISAKTSLQSIADLHGQISAREAQLRAMRVFATDNNNEVKKLSTELSVLKFELTKIEQGTGEVNTSALQLEALSAYRDMKVHEAILESMVKQAQLARIDEAKEGQTIQVVDPATPPERRSSPQRILLVLITFFVGLVLSVTIVLLRNALTKASHSLQNEAMIARLKRAWSV